MGKTIMLIIEESLGTTPYQRESLMILVRLIISGYIPFVGISLKMLLVEQKTFLLIEL